MVKITKQMEDEHDAKIDHILEHLGTRALDTQAARMSQVLGGEAQLKHVERTYKRSLAKEKAMKEHESAHWGQGGKSNPDSHTK